MNETELMEKLKRAAELQAEKKKVQQERFKALIVKLRATNEATSHPEQTTPE